MFFSSKAVWIFSYTIYKNTTNLQILHMLKHLFIFFSLYLQIRKKIHSPCNMINLNKSPIRTCILIQGAMSNKNYTRPIIKHKIKLKLLIIDIWINFGRNKFYKRDHTNILMVVCTCLRALA